MTNQKIFLIGFIISVLSIIAWYVVGCPLVDKCPFVRFEKEDPPKVILTFIGHSDNASDWNAIFSKFNAYKKRPENGFLDVIIKYERVCDPICDQDDYEDIVRERQYEDEGPNIFMAYSSWIPRYRDKLLPAPKEMMNLAEFENTFAQVTKNDLTDEKGNIYALPFYVDTLALYYDNDAFLNENLIKPPANWDEFEKYVEKLTIVDKDGDFIRTGAAFGGGNNINRSQDILMLLIMQNNNISSSEEMESLVSFDNKGSSAAVNFYTDFANPERRFYTWNENQMYSIDAFTQKKAAMMINYSHHIDNVIEKTSNNLNFKIAPIPQLDRNNKVNYASYWVPVVPKKASCGKEIKTNANCYSLAWEFLDFAAKKQNAKLYLDSTKKPAANLELAKEQFTDFNDQRSVFAGQVFTAKSWEHPDSSLSDKVLVKMIDSIITTNQEFKESILEAMAVAARYVDSLN